MWIYSVFLMCSWIWSLAGDSIPRPQSPVKERASQTYRFVLKRQGDSARAYTEGERTVFEVTSVMGIGEIEIRRADGKWPKQASIRLRYTDGRSLLSLEGFGLTSQALYVENHPVADGESRAPFRFPDRTGIVDHRLPPAGTLNLRAVRQRGALDVVLPANLLSGKRVTIRWIDHYR